MSLKLYFDLLSQPSRALYIYLKAAKVPFEPCMVPLAKSKIELNYFKFNSYLIAIVQIFYRCTVETRIRKNKPISESSMY